MTNGNNDEKIILVTESNVDEIVLPADFEKEIKAGEDLVFSNHNEKKSLKFRIVCYECEKGKLKNEN